MSKSKSNEVLMPGSAVNPPWHRRKVGLHPLGGLQESSHRGLFVERRLKLKMIRIFTFPLRFLSKYGSSKRIKPLVCFCSLEGHWVPTRSRRAVRSAVAARSEARSPVLWRRVSTATRPPSASSSRILPCFTPPISLSPKALKECQRFWWPRTAKSLGGRT